MFCEIARKERLLFGLNVFGEFGCAELEEVDGLGMIAEGVIV